MIHSKTKFNCIDKFGAFEEQLSPVNHQVMYNSRIAFLRIFNRRGDYFLQPLFRGNDNFDIREWYLHNSLLRFA